MFVRTLAFAGLLTVGAALTVVVRAEEPTGRVEAKEIARAEGPPLQASLHLPAAPNGCAVVLTPGQSGGRERPVSKTTAEALAEAGFTVVRFDWPYFTAGGTTPSEDLGVEADALDTVVDYARALPGVERVVVGGKSLGVMVIAERVARRSKKIAGLLLLTPPLVRGGELWAGEEKVRKSKIPILIVSGDADPLCPLERLYAWVGTFEVPPRVVVVPGDHGLTPPRPLTESAPPDEAAMRENVGLCAAAAALWARRFAEAAKEGR